ncbi:GntR family transcriptional regulator [Enterovibrio sp. ZSDZ35]|uniref:GntR family transcriptional regulator n=1 Tax=Enterovibrio qingdaonensis TaxID=2899818 RepID=A0ABT5QHE8_9GAMM|nr:GntR family transcriptional regulator [Enterovibrio sp. ZSDZ35]MDD1779910.1 GntR family transcriptional regulator [Enterovibrio sp. ZSDZ35]
MSKRAHVRQQLLQFIASSSPGMRLPSERELASKYKVARETLRRAMLELEAEGQIVRKVGAGNFVADKPETKQLSLRSFSEEMRLKGLTPSSKIIHSEILSAGAKISQMLKIPPSEQVYKIVRIRYANDQPMAKETTYLPCRLLPSFNPSMLEHGSLYTILEQDYQYVLSQADQFIEATVIEPEEASLLNVAPYSAGLLIERQMSTADDTPIEFCKTLYRSDRYKFEVQIRRNK